MSSLTSCTGDNHSTITTSELATNGAKTEEPVARFPRQLLHERHLGSFQRSFTFPGIVNETGLKATLKNGVLRLVVPKKTPGVAYETKVDIDIL